MPTTGEVGSDQGEMKPPETRGESQSVQQIHLKLEVFKEVNLPFLLVPEFKTVQIPKLKKLEN